MLPIQLVTWRKQYIQSVKTVCKWYSLIKFISILCSNFNRMNEILLPQLFQWGCHSQIGGSQVCHKNMTECRRYCKTQVKRLPCFYWHCGLKWIRDNKGSCGFWTRPCGTVHENHCQMEKTQILSKQICWFKFIEDRYLLSALVLFCFVRGFAWTY